MTDSENRGFAQSMAFADAYCNTIHIRTSPSHNSTHSPIALPVNQCLPRNMNGGYHMHSLVRASILALAGLVPFSASSQTHYTIQSLQLNQDGAGDWPLQYDWNRDGIPDFLASGDTNQNLISNSKTGAYTYQKAPGSLEGAIGDFNNDGKFDYAFASINYFYVDFGNGSGGFTPGPSSQGAPGVYGCFAYVVADFNGDGRQDIAGAFETSQTSTTGGTFGVALYLNNGNGFNTGKIVFQSTIPSGNQGSWPYTYRANTPAIFYDFAVGDFDRDGHADLMLRTLYSSYNTPQPIPVTDIRVLYGDAHGNFTAKSVTSNHTLDQVSAADMNNDGSSDIVALNGNTTTVYYGHPNRTFTSASVSSPGGDYLEPMLVDVSGDGLKDIVYLATCPANYSCPDGPTGQIPTGIITLMQTSSHTFSSTGFTQVQDVFSRGFIGDFNHDGKLDAALFTGQEENSNYQLNDHLYLIKNTRSITPLCPAPASPGFHVCTPAGGASVASPVKFNVSASSFYPIRKMEVWIDGTKRSETYNSVGEQAYANPSLSLSAGSHRVTLFAGAYDGSVRKLVTQSQ